MFNHLKANSYKLTAREGFTLIEILIAICIFLIVTLGIFLSFGNILEVIGRTRLRTLATSVLNKEIEILRNLPYDSVGIIGGYPIGQILASKTVAYEGQDFVINTTVRNIDDSLDGLVGGGIVAFDYAAQVGDGGVTMLNQAKITGALYSNGNLTGGSSGGVVGSAIVSGNHSIQNTKITGDARAHTISGATIGGDAYYQSISGSSVTGSLHPGSADSAVGLLPISQNQIDSWKTEAAASSTYAGNYTLGSGAATIGPLKIQGNLTVQNSAVLTLAGKVWVTGTITFANSAALQLASSYGTKSGILIADGAISMTNSFNVCGSAGYNAGTNKCNTSNGSFVTIISGSSANPAINIQNSADMQGILYAPTGYITVGNSAILREASAYGLTISNTAQIIYDSTLGAVNTGSSPVDLAPADYKLVEIRVDCPNCFAFTPIAFTTWVSPQNLEASTRNGSLFINVFDANGVAVSNADVVVKNTAISPSITINDSTGISGLLQLVDIPTSTNAYQISISKPGYTSAKTYTSGAAANPNPLQPHATVASQSVTAISFAIDRTSTINVTSQDYLCRAIPSVGFNQVGLKLIGSGPSVYAYSNSSITDSSGQISISNLGWDTYTFTSTSSLYDLSGSMPLSPLTINPNTTTALALVFEPKATSTLLATITDAGGLSIADASVNLQKSGFNDTKLTGERFYTETAWPSGGYTAQDGNIDDTSPADTIQLLQIGGSYPTSTNSYLISNTLDAGSASTTWHSISWTGSTPTNTTLRFQLADSNGSSSYLYAGPDGTGSTYYTASSTIGAMHDGKRYLRYKAYFNTTDTNVTPTLSDVSIGFASGCIPPGQATWSGLASGTYTMTATKTGYATATSTVTVGSSGWQEKRLIMQ